MRYFDLHCDTARVCYKRDVFPDDSSIAVSIPKGIKFDDWYQCYAVFVPDNCHYPKQEYKNTLFDFRRKIAAYRKPKCIFTLENARVIDSPDFVNQLVKDEIRAVTLTWNGENALAGGVNSDSGLKPFGKEIINALNRSKIAVDLSHLNRKSFFEAGETAEIVYASHTCCYKTHRNLRNLTDEQIKYIVSRGGVIGLCFYPEFLGTKYALEGVWRHLNHLLNLGCQNNISIGSDFDGAEMADDLDGIDKLPDLYFFLKSRGISENILDSVFFENAKNFFENF